MNIPFSSIFSNPFTNEKADFTDSMSKDQIKKVIFKPNSEEVDSEDRRKFLRRMCNGAIGVGAANRVGTILYEARNSEVVNGHFIDIEVENKVSSVSGLSFNTESEYVGKRNKLAIPVYIEGNPSEDVAIQSQCEHKNGFEYKDYVRIGEQKSSKIMIGITDKKTLSMSGRPVRAKIVAKKD